MKRFIVIIAAILMWCGTASAQNIRLGDKIPDTNIQSQLGDHLRLVKYEYTCLVFMHSKCEPCKTALPHLHQLTSSLNDKLAIVLLTYESPDMREHLQREYGDYVTSITFDRDKHTFRTFGVNFVPFGVIYNTKSRRIEWFGSIQQLDSKQLEEICNPKK